MNSQLYIFLNLAFNLMINFKVILGVKLNLKYFRENKLTNRGSTRISSAVVTIKTYSIYVLVLLFFSKRILNRSLIECFHCR